MKLNPYEVIQALEQAGGSSQKVKILKDNDSPLMRAIVKNACDPFTVFGVKQFKFHDESAGHLDFDHDFRYADLILTELSRQRLSGGQALEAIFGASKHLNNEQRDVLRRVLEKDLRCGVSVATANKAYPDLIPVWKMMKASPMNWDHVVYPCLAEIKENGFGNNAVIDGKEVKHFSNNGKPNENLSVFDTELLGIANGVPMVIFGEVRGRSGNGVDQYKASQSFRGNNADMSDAVFVIWDMMLLGEFKKQSCARPQKTRSSRLRDHLREYQINHDRDQFKVRYVKQYTVGSDKELGTLYSKVVRKGHEGLIVKNLNAPYEFRRGKSWLKLKEKHTRDLEICGVKEGLKSLAGTLGSVTVWNGDVKVDCPMGKGVDRVMATELWELYLKDENSLIGEIAEVSFQNETPDGSLFLPKFLRVRTGEKDVSDKPRTKKSGKKKKK
jgi:DNA ligase-1